MRYSVRQILIWYHGATLVQRRKRAEAFCDQTMSNIEVDGKDRDSYLKGIINGDR